MIKLHLNNGDTIRVNERELIWGQFSDRYVETDNQIGFTNSMTKNMNIDLLEVMSKHTGDYNYILFDNKIIPVRSICYVEE